MPLVRRDVAIGWPKRVVTANITCRFACSSGESGSQTRWLAGRPLGGFWSWNHSHCFESAVSTVDEESTCRLDRFFDGGKTIGRPGTYLANIKSGGNVGEEREADGDLKPSFRTSPGQKRPPDSGKVKRVYRTDESNRKRNIGAHTTLKQLPSGRSKLFRGCAD